MRRLAALTGLASEARILSAAAASADTDIEVVTAVGGADPDRARREAQRLVAAAPDLLVSFGLAGGLVDGLAPGDAVCPAKVRLSDGGDIATDPIWGAAFRAAWGQPLAECPVAGRDAPVTTPAAKRALARATGACIVDMESHVVAEAARRAGVPCLALRAVCDPAGRTVPTALLRLIDPRGRLRWRLLPTVLRHPGAALALGRDSRRATATLRDLAAALMRAMR